jgi:hypothetical protein
MVSLPRRTQIVDDYGLLRENFQLIEGLLFCHLPGNQGAHQVSVEGAALLLIGLLENLRVASEKGDPLQEGGCLSRLLQLAMEFGRLGRLRGRLRHTGGVLRLFYHYHVSLILISIFHDRNLSCRVSIFVPDVICVQGHSLDHVLGVGNLRISKAG